MAGYVSPAGNHDLDFPIHLDGNGCGVGIFRLIGCVGRTIYFPNFFPGLSIQSDDVSRHFSILPSDHAYYQISFVQKWGGCKSPVEPEFTVGFFEAHFPERFAIDGVSTNNSVAGGRPDVFPIANR